jgi:hypothetical protein
VSETGATAPATHSLFEQWSVPECPFVIEYRPELMQELRAAAAYGQQALARGGIEVGGVLFGSRSPGGISIRDWRPIPCEHAAGPAFVLSDRDIAELKKLLQTRAGDAALAEAEPLGWFVSHTRSDLALRDSDLAIYNEFFPAATDVTLALRPGRHGAARAGFFFRDAGGEARTDQSFLEFNIDSIESAHTGAAPRPRTREPERARESLLPAPLPEIGAPVAEARAVRETLPVETRLRMPWPVALAAGLLLGAVAAWFALHPSQPSAPAETPVDMTVMDRDGQLVIQWDHAAEPMAAVRGGVVAIADDAPEQRFPLSAAQARTGSFTWARHSGDVRVALRFDTGGKPLSAFARFVGAAPAPAVRPAAPPVRTIRDPAAAQLRRENASLRADVAREQARTAQAETVVRILRNRLDAAEAGRK